jgi:hypothetical protein
MIKRPTIWAALATRLGRQPTHAEAQAEVRRILGMPGTPQPASDPLAGLPRVQLHPATDAWMQGDRYGVVLRRLPRNRVLVQLDKSGRQIRLKEDDVAWL